MKYGSNPELATKSVSATGRPERAKNPFKTSAANKMK